MIQEKPIEKFVDKYTEQERLEFAKANKPYLEFVINDSKQFRDFGVDQTMVEALETVDPKIVHLMDDKFLSILLAPKNKISIDFYDAIRPHHPRNKAVEFVEQSLFRNTKKAQKHRIKDKKTEIFNLIGTFATNEQRITKIKKLDSVFTFDEIRKIFDYNNMQKEHALLNWLAGFKTSEREQRLIDYIKG